MFCIFQRVLCPALSLKMKNVPYLYLEMKNIPCFFFKSEKKIHPIIFLLSTGRQENEISAKNSEILLEKCEPMKIPALKCIELYVKIPF